MYAQVHTFSTGGFCVHGAMKAGRKRYSAWYSEDGTLLDAELHTSNGQVRRVKRNTRPWLMLQTNAELYRPRPA